MTQDQLAILQRLLVEAALGIADLPDHDDRNTAAGVLAEIDAGWDEETDDD